MSTSEGTRPADAPPAGEVTADDAVGGVEPGYASWPHRVVAAVLDDAILAGVVWLVLGTGFVQPTLTPVLGADGASWPSDPLVLVPVGVALVLLVLQGTTGWTPGKLVAGIRVVDAATREPIGVGRTIGRWLLHLLDAMLFIGYLRPLWHRRRQTFADSITGTVVVPAVPDLPRRPRIVLYSAALVVCVLGLGYGCVPLGSEGTSSLEIGATCEIDGTGPALTTGTVALSGSVWTSGERRLWTVRETRTVQPVARLTWTSDESARDVGYRVELDARPAEGGPSRGFTESWDIGTGSTDGTVDGEDTLHTRSLGPDGDRHDVEVQASQDDALGDLRGVRLTARLLADGEPVAVCETVTDHGA